MCLKTCDLIWLGNGGFEMVSIELDYKQVVKDLYNNIDISFELGVILNYGKASLSLLSNFKLNFVRRQAKCKGIHCTLMHFN